MSVIPVSPLRGMAPAASASHTPPKPRISQPHERNAPSQLQHAQAALANWPTGSWAGAEKCSIYCLTKREPSLLRNTEQRFRYA